MPPDTIPEAADINSSPRILLTQFSTNPDHLSDDLHIGETLNYKDDGLVKDNKFLQNKDFANEKNPVEICGADASYHEPVLPENDAMSFHPSNCNKLCSSNSNSDADNRTSTKSQTEQDNANCLASSYMIYQHKLIREFKRLALYVWLFDIILSSLFY